ncbi:MAG: replication initiation factor domain-containing protein [Geobacter sp.]|nr:MAG: replication initiation factor domain-containing protein [Geobacter sp.]
MQLTAATDLTTVNTTSCITHTTNPTPACIDYLSFTLPDDTNLKTFLSDTFRLSWDTLEKASKGYNGYYERYHHGNLTVLTNGGAKGMGHNITLTGKACNRLKDHLPRIIDEVYKANGHFTRCDIAIDDYHGLLDLGTIQSSIADGLVVSRCKYLREYNERGKDGRFTGRGAYFGGRKSQLFIRIYDKALQQGEDYHWVRVELELKKGKANEAMKLARGGDLGVMAKAILKDSLSFRIKGEQMNRSRWPVAPWWDTFLEGVERLKLAAPKDEDIASQERRLKWFMRHARTLAEIVDVCGPSILQTMYNRGKSIQAARPTVH